MKVRQLIAALSHMDQDLEVAAVDGPTSVDMYPIQSLREGKQWLVLITARALWEMQ